MRSKRLNIDFSQHELLITKQEGLLIHHLKKPDTVIDNIKYINTNGVMVVTGDYGNWIFCREFHPSPKTQSIPDGYWCEKLEILSSQKPYEYSPEKTLASIEERMREEADNLTEEEKEYYEECIELVDDQFDYEYYAYRSMPENWDYESVIVCHEIKTWLKAVFDGFEEICERLRVAELKLETLTP